MNIALPTKKSDTPYRPEIEFSQLVVIGANGSGKTRFGSDIEERNNKITHRISAQKSLKMPQYVSTKSKETAMAEFRFGAYNENEDWLMKHGWRSSRWGGKLSTHMLDDYEKLMVLLHTEEFEESLRYKESGGVKPITKLDRIQKIFELVLPHRKINKKAGVIEIYPADNIEAVYSSSEMSDGERVIFYLAGEVVCAADNSIIILDEPEMHIHSSLMKILFDLIENERPDCSFIYLTHNIDFAFTRQNAQKIWVKSYLNSEWDYEILDGVSPIPEQLFLEVLGSRKPILFSEGNSSSIDYEIYEQVFPEYTIKPIDGCEKVIPTVKSFNEQNSFHHIQSFGIIDLDRREERDVANLTSAGIWVLDVAEAENLLLLEEVVKAVASHMGKDADQVFDHVKANLIDFFNTQLESQVLINYKEVLRRKFVTLSNFTSTDIDTAISEVQANYDSIDKHSLFEDVKLQFDTVAADNNYAGILRLFNLKNALIPQSRVCEMTSIRNKEAYKNIVISLLKKKDEVSSHLQAAIKAKVRTSI